MAGTTRSGTNVGLPKDHWIHKAVAKEKGRIARKSVNGSAINSAPTQAMQQGTKKPMAGKGMKNLAEDGEHSY